MHDYLSKPVRSEDLAMTSMTAALGVQYDDVERQDATVTVDPAAADSVGAALTGLAHVTAVPSLVGVVTVAAGNRSYATTLQGFERDTRMHGWRTSGSTPPALPDAGLLAGSELAQTLGVSAGDTVTVTESGGASSPVRVAGFVDEPLGAILYAATNVAGPLLGDAGVRTYLVRFSSRADHDQLREAISRMDGVVAYSDTDALVTSLDQFLGLFRAFVAVMVLLGTLLALAIIYVTMSVTERTNELATLRAAGVPLRRVGGALATENLAATLLGLPAGLVLGVLAASQWPAVRAVRRLDVARVVRERAG